MSVAATVAQSARPNFLILAPVCVFPGLAAAHAAGFTPDLATGVLIVLAAILAHAAVNLLNEWDDFRSGLDLATQRTPFSGGSGALPAVPKAASAVLAAGLASMGTSALIGIYLMTQAGIGLLLPGLLGVFLVIAYTAWITRRPLLCLLAPGLGFGPIIVAGSYYAVAGDYSPTILWASMTPLFLVSGLLLINQLPDLEPDRDHGRLHIPILLGRTAAARLFALVLALAYLAPLVGVWIGVLPTMSLLALIPAPVALALAINAVRHAENTQSLTPWLGVNVATLMLTIVLLGVGLLLG